MSNNKSAPASGGDVRNVIDWDQMLGPNRGGQAPPNARPAGLSGPESEGEVDHRMAGMADMADDEPTLEEEVDRARAHFGRRIFNRRRRERGMGAAGSGVEQAGPSRRGGREAHRGCQRRSSLNVFTHGAVDLLLDFDRGILQISKKRKCFRISMIFLW